jgi:uncharacterized protein YdiU (UPF0061 family)
MSNKLILLSQKQNNSFIASLNKDPETDKYKPNKTSRQVKSGHYVPVSPTPLPDPYLVIFSSDMGKQLGLDCDTCISNDFIKLFSGQIDILEKGSWATPYALSIYGKEIYSNCPFKSDTGYGDGRALSIGEFIVDKNRWELQLKGAGTSPFSRGADGRAVLRSCIREFIASEAMYHLNVPTSRALSIIGSKTEKVARQWYSDKGEEIMENAICAMLCRTASSFLRVGQIELYARRVHKFPLEKEFRLSELKMIVDHTISREFPHLNNIQDTQSRYIALLKEIGMRIAELTTNWLRVGYTQGNFNSDNCHVAGLTLDYGPFGFIEQFDPEWNMWQGGGLHFAFMNQPLAGNKNFGSLVDAIIPLLNTENQQIANKMKSQQYEIALNRANLMWANKLGFSQFNSKVAELKNKLFELMEKNGADFTIFWRQLCYLVENYNGENLGLFSYIKSCFYNKLTTTGEPRNSSNSFGLSSNDDENNWLEWLKKWLQMLNTNGDYSNFKEISNKMKSISPKFVPREWMLKLAYEEANKGNNDIMNEIHILLKTPYSEHNNDLTLRYYKKNGVKMTGITSMSCSS